MTTVILDYAHHPFIRRTAEHLAAQGKPVRYLYNASFGGPNRDGGLPDGTVVRGLPIAGTWRKEAYVRRWFQERAWTTEACRLIATWAPSRVAVANAPLHVYAGVSRWCRANAVPFVFWMQDINSRAMADIIASRIPLAGGLLAKRWERQEGALVAAATKAVFISDGFRDYWRGRTTLPPHAVLPNWSTLADLPPCPRDNAWTAEQGLGAGPRLLYAGTIGRKHPLELLRGVASAAHGAGGSFTVVSGGEWAHRLATEAPQGLRLLPFQPFARLPEVLGSADVLVAVLGEDASAFSVPSKILTYLCAGRPVLAVMPSDNPSARLILEAGAGVCVPPDDPQEASAAVARLLADADGRARMGAAARAWAERAFDPDRVADRMWAALHD